jgi:uncharacterized protein YbaP (TraB family)
MKRGALVVALVLFLCGAVSAPASVPGGLRNNHEGDTFHSVAVVRDSTGPVAGHDCDGEKRPFFWQVKGAKNTVYLFGSIHFGKPDFYPLAPVVESAFDRSSHLVVEIDASSEAFKKEQTQFIALSLLPEGKTIRDVISPGVYQKLTEAVEQLGLPFEIIERFRPWVTAVTLTALKLEAMGYIPNFGVDQYFLGRVKKGQTVLELESFGEQVRLFESVGEERFLAYTLLSLNGVELKSEELITAWRCGDLKAMKGILFDDLTSGMIDNIGEIYDKLFFSRNRKMTDKIKSYLEKEGDFFVVVGAGHLVGERSIVDLLRAEGYTVTGP